MGWVLRAVRRIVFWPSEGRALDEIGYHRVDGSELAEGVDREAGFDAALAAAQRVMCLGQPR